MATRAFDSLLEAALQHDDLDVTVQLAEALCAIHLGLPELSEPAWAEVLGQGGLIYDVLYRAMNGLCEAGKADESFVLSQRWKSPAFVRPLIDSHRDAGPGRGRLRRAGFYAAYDTVREGVRRLAAATDADSTVAALTWTRGAAAALHRELDTLATVDPVHAFRLGLPAQPDDLIDALPERGGAVCLVDLFVGHTGTLAHLVYRNGNNVTVTGVEITVFPLDEALKLADVHRALVIDRTEEGREDEAIEHVSAVLHARLWCHIARLVGRLGCSQIILVPDAWTRGLPHHLARVCGEEIDVPADVPVVQRERLADLFPVELAPAVQAVAVSQWQLRPTQVEKVLMVADPGGDLPGARYSVTWIEERLSEDVDFRPLVGSAATKRRVLDEADDATMIVWCGHGDFREDDVAASNLELSDEDLTLADVVAGDAVRPGALYVLSTCELGINTAGETAGGSALPGALLSGGAASVVAALWELEDVSFGYLTERYLHHLAYPGYRPAAALFRAMNDLKQWPKADVVTRLEQFVRAMEADGTAAARPGDYYRLVTLLTTITDDEREHPFAAVRHWGGAVVFGSGWAFQQGAHLSDNEHPLRSVEVLLSRKPDQVREMIAEGRLGEAHEELDAWLAWAHGPERLDPLALQAQLARAAGAEPRVVAWLYQRLAVAAAAHGRQELVTWTDEQLATLRQH